MDARSRGREPGRGAARPAGGGPGRGLHPASQVHRLGGAQRAHGPDRDGLLSRRAHLRRSEERRDQGVLEPVGHQPVTVADLSSEVDNYRRRPARARAGARLPDQPVRLRALHASTRTIGGTPPVWNDGCPTPPGPTTDGCVVIGPAVAAAGQRRHDDRYRAGADQRLVPAVPDALGRRRCCSARTATSTPAAATAAASPRSTTASSVDDAGDQANPCGDPPGGVGDGARRHRRPRAARSAAQSVRRTAGPTLLNGTVIRVDPATGAACRTTRLLHARRRRQREADRRLRDAQPVPDHPAPRHRRAVDRRRRLGHLGGDRPGGLADGGDRAELRLALLRGQRGRSPATRPLAWTCAHRCTRRRER